MSRSTRMKNRVIAAMMVVALLWGSGTVTFASLTYGPAMMRHAARSGQRAAMPHACCPSSHPLTTPEFFVASNEPVTPCSEHPCCAKRRPQVPASIPAVNEGKSPDQRIVKVSVPLKFASTHDAIAADAYHVFSPPSSSWSTVLRI